MKQNSKCLENYTIKDQMTLALLYNELLDVA